PGAEGHRRKETAYELPGLFADVDFKGMGQEAVIQHLEANGSADRVTIIVNSGGGFHPYAKFEKPVMVDQVGRQGLEQYLYAFGAFLAGGRGPERFDLASILRVPGTVNYPDTRKRKQGRQASPTEVCDCIESRF